MSIGIHAADQGAHVLRANLARQLTVFGTKRRRRAALEGGEVRIEDTFFLEKPTKLEFHFLSAVKPECGKGEVRLGSRALLYPEALSVKAEEIPLSSVMALRWDRPSLWRITLTADSVKDGVFLFRIL